MSNKPDKDQNAPKMSKELSMIDGKLRCLKESIFKSKVKTSSNNNPKEDKNITIDRVKDNNNKILSQVEHDININTKALNNDSTIKTAKNHIVNVKAKP